MKKLFSLVLAVISVLILTVGVSAKTVLKGDFNLDGKITAADARGTLRVSAKLDTADATKMLVADVTNDKKITASDARKILRAAARLEGSLGEIEIGSEAETTTAPVKETTTVSEKETTTVPEKETTTAPVVKTELSSLINIDIDSCRKEYENMVKVESEGTVTTYSNGKLSFTTDSSLIDENKISSITVYDSAYLLNGISVDMTPSKAADTLKKSDWIVISQDSEEIVLTKIGMKIVINIEDEKITSIEYIFAESLLSPDETTTVPVTETTTVPATETTTVPATETTTVPVTETTTVPVTETTTVPVTETTTVPVTETTTVPVTETTTEDKHEHSYISSTLAPTCTTNGFTTYTCIVCGDSYTADEKAATGHDYVETIVAPTCTEEGFTVHTCSKCDDSYTTDTVPAKHNAIWVNIVSPAPGVEGLDQYKCKKCSAILNEAIIPALPLPETTTEEPTTEEPTTEEPTTEEPTTEEPTTEEPTTEEPTTEEPTTEEPTTEDPTTEEPTTEEPTTEEPTTEEPTTEEPTTEEPSTDEPVSEESSTEHIHNFEFFITPPTCEENGFTRFTCTGCDYAYEDDIIYASGHNPVWEIITPADVGVEGLKQNKCRVCGHVVAEEIIPALTEEEIETPEGEITVDQLPAQIKAFMNGHFGIEGYTYSGKDKSAMSMYVSPNHVKAGMDLSGMQIDMLIRDVNKKPSVYLIRPDVKKYAKLTSADMAALGITVDDLKIDFGGGMATPDSIVLSNQTISGVAYKIYTLYAGSEYCKIYMDGDNIKRIETYNTESKMLITRIDVTTFISYPGDSEFTTSSYKNALSYLLLFL